MSLDANIIDRIAAIAIQAHTSRPDAGFIAVAPNTTLQSLEKFNPIPNRQRSNYTTRRVPDFLAYAAKYQTPSSAFFVDPDSLMVNGIFDYDPGWADHQSVLELVKTPEYASVADHQGTWTQQQLREWLEDYAGENTITPQRNGQPISVAIALQAISTIKIKNSTEATTTLNQLSATRSVLDDVALSGGDKDAALPDSFILKTPLYENTATQSIELKLTLRNVGEGDKATTALSLRIIAHDALKKAVAEELESSIKEAITLGSVYTGKVINTQPK